MPSLIPITPQVSPRFTEAGHASAEFVIAAAALTTNMATQPTAKAWDSVVANWVGGALWARSGWIEMNRSPNAAPVGYGREFLDFCY